MSEEWSEPFSTMVSPSRLWGVGERERLRRMGEQAGVLLFELLAVLVGKREGEHERERETDRQYEKQRHSYHINVINVHLLI